MASSTKIRAFSRLLDRASTPLWVVDPDGCLIFLSAAAGRWLSLDPELLIGRRCVAGSSISGDPLDYLAASLAAPPGFSERGTASLLIQPAVPSGGSGTGVARRFEPLETRFVRVGEAEESFTVATAGQFDDQRTDGSVQSAVALRQQLDHWRRHHDWMARGIAVGRSRHAARIQRQIDLAAAVRADLIVRAPGGCFADSVATTVHHRVAPDEPMAMIDGPLMDAELLDASLGVLTAHLGDASDSALATAVVDGLDEMPQEAQQRLEETLDRYGGRLRLIAVVGPAPRFARSDDSTESGDAGELFDDAPLPVGVEQGLADRLCGLSIHLPSLAERVEDLPLIAAALLERRRAGGDTTADRFGRDAMDALVLYPWPDNLRELDQAVRHAGRRSTGSVISTEHLPLAIRSYRPNETIAPQMQAIDLDKVVASFEAELILNALEVADGNRAQAARQLNISRARLLRKLESLEDASGQAENGPGENGRSGRTP